MLRTRGCKYLNIFSLHNIFYIDDEELWIVKKEWTRSGNTCSDANTRTGSLSICFVFSSSLMVSQWKTYQFLDILALLSVERIILLLDGLRDSATRTLQPSSTHGRDWDSFNFLSIIDLKSFFLSYPVAWQNPRRPTKHSTSHSSHIHPSNQSKNHK